MRTNNVILAVLVAFVLALPFSSYAKGRGGGYSCKTTAECQERKAAQEKRAAEKAEEAAKDAAEEKAEQAKARQAVASGLEQVEEISAGEREINSWIRKNPRVRIVRVLALPRSDTVLIFYRASK